MTVPVKLFTAAEVATTLRVKPFEVTKMCRDGRIKASRPGRSWLIHPDDLQAFLDDHSNEKAAS